MRCIDTDAENRTHGDCWSSTFDVISRYSAGYL